MKLKRIYLVFAAAILVSSLGGQIYNPLKEQKITLQAVQIVKKHLYNLNDFIILRGYSFEQKKIFTVELAPEWFLQKYSFEKIKIGDKIQFVGSFLATKTNWFMARELMKESIRIKIRTETGFPLWRVNKQN